jgi:hypothetical protein
MPAEANKYGMAAVQPIASVDSWYSLSISGNQMPIP